jgi:hypothetical protein
MSEGSGEWNNKLDCRVNVVVEGYYTEIGQMGRNRQVDMVPNGPTHISFNACDDLPDGT